jgi:hypothetical protein
VNFLR